MKRREHPLIVATMEAFARRAGIDPADLWAYVDRKKSPPTNVRDAIVAAFFPLVPPDSFLPSPGENGTLNTVNASAVSSNALRSRARLSEGALKSRAVRVLARKGITIAEAAGAIAEKLGRKIPRSTVQAWVKEKGDPSYRAIPDDAADAFADLYGVPKTSWPRVIPAP